jgi:hypothetical protein
VSCGQNNSGGVDALGHIKVLVGVLAQDRGGEGPEPLAELNLDVHHRLHLGVARVAEYAARAQGAGAELHAPLEPADNLAVRQRLCHPLAQGVLVTDVRVGRLDAVEVVLDLLVGVLGAHERRPLAVTGPGHARLVEQLVPDEQGRALGAAGVAGGRLNPDVLERPLPQDVLVGHAVQRHAAGQA